MSGPGQGISTLLQNCERLAITCDLGSATSMVPGMIAGVPLDPELSALYHIHDGVHCSAVDFDFQIYPLTGPDSVEWRNVSERHAAEDYVPDYPFEGVMLFAQYGLKASYLATIPALSDPAGRQPVLYLDTNETVWAVPIASSVDRAFALISRYMEGVIARYGRAGLVEVQFPLDVPRLVADDVDLANQVKNGKILNWVRGDVTIQDWLHAAFSL